MKLRIMMVLLALAGLVRVHATDAKASFDRGKYAEAIAPLEQQAETGPPSAETYYDLGLTCEKAGETVKAALNYQRALLLDPSLAPARNQLGKLAAAHEIPLRPRDWTDDITAVVNPETLVVLGSTLAWAGAFALIFASQAKRRRALWNTLAAIAFLVGVGGLVVGGLSDARLAAARPAMVTAKDGAEVLTAPANNSDVVASLPAGAPVGVVSPRGAWAYVDLAGGAKGWVQSDRLTPIVPGEKF
jgi:tetratricopeptide (TPR) repeat protein